MVKGEEVTDLVDLEEDSEEKNGSSGRGDRTGKMVDGLWITDKYYDNYDSLTPNQKKAINEMKGNYISGKTPGSKSVTLSTISSTLTSIQSAIDRGLEQATEDNDNSNKRLATAQFLKTMGS